jgi:hypothetical protein
MKALPGRSRKVIVGFGILGFLYGGLSWSAPRAEVATHDRTDKMRSRLEQLFIWRVSDRLRLKPQEETKFTTEYKKLCDERLKLSSEVDQQLGSIEKSRGDRVALSKGLADYQALVKKQSLLQIKEIETMGKIFDPVKMAEYLLLKRDLTEKFKDVVASAAPRPAPAAVSDEPAGKAGTVVPEPVVIQEESK